MANTLHNMKLLSVSKKIVLYFILLLTLLILLYISLTLEARGDESTVYLNSFNQASSKFPLIDLSPYWAISSFYLWIVAALGYFFSTFTQLTNLESGRLFSLACWVGIFIISAKASVKKFPWASIMVLFNPYLLVYATRAHPLVPGLLLFTAFWITAKKNSFALILLPFAVNFQVFIAGTCGLFFPSYPFKKTEIVKFLIISVVALIGILITLITWGGLFPEKFYTSDFYKLEHVGGTPSFGYPVSVLLLSGLPLWFIGQRNFREVTFDSFQTRIVAIAVLTGCLILFFLPRGVLGIASLGTKQLLGAPNKVTWIVVYGLIGLGWLRVHRDQLSLFFALLGSGILLITLPYFYERISFFATFAPCLAWSLMPDNNSSITPNYFFYTLILIIMLSLSVFYQYFGSL